MGSDNFSLGMLAVKNTSSVNKAISKKAIKSRRFYSVIAILSLVILIGGSLSIYRITRPPQPIPANIKQAVTFPLYYPSKLPPGLAVDLTSFSATSQVMNFGINSPNGKIAISEQPKPKDFDFDSFYRDQFSGEKEILTPVGKATIGLFGDRLTASVITDKAWIIVSAPQQLPASQLEVITKELKEVR